MAIHEFMAGTGHHESMSLIATLTYARVQYLSGQAGPWPSLVRLAKGHGTNRRKRKTNHVPNATFLAVPYHNRFAITLLIVFARIGSVLASLYRN